MQPINQDGGKLHEVIHGMIKCMDKPLTSGITKAGL